MKFSLLDILKSFKLYFWEYLNDQTSSKLEGTTQMSHGILSLNLKILTVLPMAIHCLFSLELYLEHYKMALEVTFDKSIDSSLGYRGALWVIKRTKAWLVYLNFVLSSCYLNLWEGSWRRRISSCKYCKNLGRFCIILVIIFLQSWKH